MSTFMPFEQNFTGSSENWDSLLCQDVLCGVLTLGPRRLGRSGCSLPFLLSFVIFCSLAGFLRVSFRLIVA